MTDQSTASAPPAGDVPNPETPQAASGAHGEGRGTSEDLVTQARRDPQRVAELAARFQSEADRAQAEHRKLKERMGDDLESILQQVEGSVAAQAIRQYAALRNHPELGKAIQEFEQTGKLPRQGNGRSEDLDDEDLDPLEAKVNQASRETQQLAAAMGQRAITDHVQRFAQEWGLEGNEVDSVLRGMMAHVQSYSSSPAGRQQLTKLMSPDGYATVRTLALSQLSDEQIRKASSRKAASQRQRVESLSTDGPSEVSSLDAEETPQHKSAAEALRYAAQSLGRDPEAVFRRQ